MRDIKEKVEVIVFRTLNREREFLVLKRREEKGGAWQPVTGGVEKKEEVLDAVKRELEEETGIKEYIRIIDKVHFFKYKNEDGVVLDEYVFGVEVSPDVKVKISEEHIDLRWCSFGEAISLLKHEDNKMALKKLNSLVHKHDKSRH